MDLPENTKDGPPAAVGRPAIYRLSYWKARLTEREDQVFLLLTIVIGALAGLAVVAFILLTERLGARLYPPGVSVWRRLFGPMAGALSNGNMAIRVAAGLVVLKLVTSAVSASSGNAGGIFAPTLFIGAMLGGTVGGIAHFLLPHLTASPGAYALVGMGAAFAGIIRTPMTSVVLVFEVTRDYAIIVPLMIANLVSYFVSRKIYQEKLYEGIARQDGIHLPETGLRVHRDARTVSQVMHKPEEVLAADITVQEASASAKNSGLSCWPILDGRVLAGVVSGDALDRLLKEGKAEMRLGQVIDPIFPHLHSDQSLDIALERMGAAGVQMLAVVSRFDARELLGVVYLTDILNAYRVAMQLSPSAPAAADGQK
ncbi:MAG: chloride channel protein [Candidatus Acidiferrales bacterium]|jgi:CIC family chloride channel protein